MYAVIRIRGSIGVKKEIRDTLKMLRLHSVNHLVLLQETSSNKGMIKKVKDYVTFGEIEEKTLVKLLKKRGRLEGNKKIEEKKLDAEKIAKEVLGGKKVQDFGIKPVFRLNSPKKGFERKGIKKTFKEGGALGYRGKQINKLIEKMM